MRKVSVEDLRGRIQNSILPIPRGSFEKYSPVVHASQLEQIDRSATGPRQPRLLLVVLDSSSIHLARDRTSHRPKYRRGVPELVALDSFERWCEGGVDVIKVRALPARVGRSWRSDLSEGRDDRRNKHTRE